ncbi:MAG: YdbL family protein [Myxococcota bacterium]|jgi:hypothetical protein|nr:YdbL family protein [Myxococcota bacterium]
MNDPIQLQQASNSNRMRSRIAAISCTIACVLLTVPVTASAEYLLGTAKSAGQVGEQRDGYLGLIDQRAPENIKKMVVDTNERRKQRYQKVAERIGSPLEQVGKTAAMRHFKHAKPGELIQAEDGSWIKKGQLGQKPGKKALKAPSDSAPTAPADRQAAVRLGGSDDTADPSSPATSSN